MATDDFLTVVEKCRISPPPNTVGERSLPLTFFDTICLLIPPVHHLFFYEFPNSKSHFVQTVVPNFKHSLSITLQHFFPFAGNLVLFHNSNHSSAAKKPEIRHVEGDSVSVTFAECTLDFNDLSGNHPRDCDKFHRLVPLLGDAAKVSDYVTIPVFSVQVTLFPNSGIAIGLTNHHTLCDATTRFDFLKAWTSIARHRTEELFLASGSLPFYDRVIEYPNSLDEIYLRFQTLNSEYQFPQLVSDTHKVRATIVLTRAHINLLKKWVSTQLPTLKYVSSFSVVCAYVWSCIAKSRNAETNGDHDVEWFGCAMNLRARLSQPIPQTYFGNCFGACFTTGTKSTLLSGNKGFLVAAELLGNAISEAAKNMDGMIKDAETWIERCFKAVPIIGVAGTPKHKIYDVDLGFGKPKKCETISIDYNGSISVNAGKEPSEDLEIGLSLPAKQMDAFITISENELESILSKQNE